MLDVHWHGIEPSAGLIAHAPAAARARITQGLAEKLPWPDASFDVILSLTNGLASHSIRTLYLDKEGTLWIGTAGGGLSRWRDGHMITFTAAQGLAAHTVSQIVEDDGGDLWLGSNRGIFRVHKKGLNQFGQSAFVHPRVFGVSDGLPIEECSSGFCPAGLKTRAGLVCF